MLYKHFSTESCRRFFGTVAVKASSALDAPVLNLAVHSTGARLISLNPKKRPAVAKLSLAYSVGSRNESYEEKGLCHLLRRCAGLSAGEVTSISLVRHFQQMGAQFSCTGTREQLVYEAVFAPNLFDRLSSLMATAVTQNRYFYWELNREASKLMKHDIELLTRRNLEQYAYELLYDVAYQGRGLGNSLYSTIYRTSPDYFNIDVINHFLTKHLTVGNTSIIGTGLSLEQLSQFTSLIELRPNQAEDFEESKFGRGEIRKDIPVDNASIFFAWEGPGVKTSPREAMALCLFSSIIGSASQRRITWANGVEAQNRLINVIPEKARDVITSDAFFQGHSDSGIFVVGIAGVSIPELADVVKNSASHVCSVAKKSISDMDLQRAKAKAKADILMMAEHSNTNHDFVVSQLPLADEVVPAEEIISSIEKISAEDVSQVAKKFLSSPPKVMTSIGPLQYVPYLSQLA